VKFAKVSKKIKFSLSNSQKRAKNKIFFVKFAKAGKKINFFSQSHRKQEIIKRKYLYIEINLTSFDMRPILS
ncbi:MAG: hypothetical protein ACTTKC_11670, partial [Treponema sp.]|uniref:hypothetical protein n=1 Tax=Treponema sp. TaxID=166 RepID=UPI003FA239CA